MESTDSWLGPDIWTETIQEEDIQSLDPIESVVDDPGPWDEGGNVFLAFCLLSFPTVAVALSSNGLAFLVFYKKPAFRKILSNKLVMNLMTINTFSCLILFPMLVLDMRMATADQHYSNNETSPSNSTIEPNLNEVSSSVTLCILNSLLSSLVAHGSILAMLSVGVDQYLAILDPLEYPFKATRVVSWQMISLVWTLSFVSSLGTAFQMVTAARHSPWSSCRQADTSLWEWSQSDLTPWLRNRTWLAVVSFVLYCFPVFALAFMYFRIFWAARKNSRDIRRNSFHLTLPSEGDQYDDRLKSNHRDDESKQSDRSDSPPFPTPSIPPETKPEADLESPKSPKSPKSPRSPEKDTPVLSKQDSTNSEVFLNHNTCGPRRAPKLGALRASSTGNFTRPLIMTSVDVGALDDDVLVQDASGLLSGVTGNPIQRSARLERRVLVTPKRKCSFSSFSECRLVADGGKTRTFLFSMEAPSTSPPPTPIVFDTPPRTTSLNFSAAERRRQFSLGSATEHHRSMTASFQFEPHHVQLQPPQIQLQPPEIQLQPPEDPPEPAPEPANSSESPDGSNHNNGGERIRGRSLDCIEINGSSPKLSHKSGSLLSMTSQAARRLSCTVSRRASSVYQFFHYREELRTAKITALVLVIAFVCWSPFFLLLLCLALQKPSSTLIPKGQNLSSLELHLDVFNSSSNLTSPVFDASDSPSPTILWLHFASCLMSLSFAATSPYVYVFRSEKVQKCLRQLVIEFLCCCGTYTAPELTSKLASRAGSISCMQPTAHPSTMSCGNGLLSVKKASPTMSANRISLRPNDMLQQDQRSHSCPDLDVDQPVNQGSTPIGEQSKAPSRESIIEMKPAPIALTTLAPAVNVVKTNGDVRRSKDDLILSHRYKSPTFLSVPVGKYCRSFNRKSPCTRSNLEIEDDILEEEEEEMFLNEYNLEHRRLSTSLPFGLNLLERPPLETTV